MENKRFKGAISLPLQLLLAFIAAFMIYQFFFGMTGAQLLDRAVLLPVAALLFWIVFGTYYELRQDMLYLRCGPLSMRIRYEDIESVDMGHSLFTINFSFSFNCVEIRRRGKKMRVAVSPAEPNRFICELRARLHAD